MSKLGKYLASPQAVPEVTAMSLGVALENLRVSSVAVDKLETTINGLTEVSLGLETVSENIVIASENGAMSVTSAKYAHIVTDAHLARVGLEAKQVLPGVENFDPSVAIEGIGETLKKIWIAIRDAVLAALKKLKEFFGFAGDVAEKHEQTAVKNEGLLSTFNFAEAFPPPEKAVLEFVKEKKITVPDLSSITMGGKVTEKTILDGSKKLQSLAKELAVLSTEYREAGESTALVVKSILKKGNLDALDTLKTDVNAGTGAKKVIKLNPLPGDMKAAFSDPKTKKDNLHFIAVKGKKKLKPNEHVPVLDISKTEEINKVIAEVSKVMRGIIDDGVFVGDLEDESVSLVDGIQGNTGNKVPPEVIKAASELVKNSRTVTFYAMAKYLSAVTTGYGKYVRYVIEVAEANSKS